MRELVLTRDNRGFPLDLPAGYFMCWNFTTQAANRARVKLYDEKTVYLNQERQSRNPQPVISGSADILGSQLRIEFDVPASKELKIRMDSWDLTKGSQLIARSIVILVEDQGDDDYNDIVVNITSWAAKG